MKSKIKILDTFQIVGFVISVFISLLLVISGQDTIGSVTLGLVLAIMIQLFDLQLRQSDTEERVLSATSLDQALYEDRWLLNHIQQIVNDYMVVRSGWFQLFSDRAIDVIADTRNNLHLMAEGYMVAEPYSPFTFGRHFKHATKSIKHVITRINYPYWQSRYAKGGFEFVADIIKQGVTYTRVFILPLDTLKTMVDFLEGQRDIGIQVFIVFPEELPTSLTDDFVLVDDRALAQLVFKADNDLKEQRISIEPVDVEQMVKKFDLIIYHARKLEMVLDRLKLSDSSSS